MHPSLWLQVGCPWKGTGGTGGFHVAFAKGPPSKKPTPNHHFLLSDRKWRDFLIFLQKKREIKMVSPTCFFSFMKTWTDSKWSDFPPPKWSPWERGRSDTNIWAMKKKTWLLRVYRWLYYQLCGDYNKTSIRIPIKQPVFIVYRRKITGFFWWLILSWCFRRLFVLTFSGNDTTLQGRGT